MPAKSVKRKSKRLILLVHKHLKANSRKITIKLKVIVKLGMENTTRVSLTFIVTKLFWKSNLRKKKVKRAISAKKATVRIIWNFALVGLDMIVDRSGIAHNDQVFARARK